MSLGEVKLDLLPFLMHESGGLLRKWGLLEAGHITISKG